ncbi:MAG: trehalase family glycosidase [Anaerolineae bacterium]|nr:trehalase family glycosidase [Anaerolineae bacterium]
MEWFIEENERCRSGESGMDNSQRFDEALLLDAVDFSVFAALDMAYLSRIYAELDDNENETFWKQQSETLSSAIHANLWSGEAGFYLDRRMDGSFSPIQAVTGFLPLLLDDFPVERLDPLIDALQDESRFNTAFPLPSVAVHTPDFSTDMWRGATWVNLNFLVAKGFDHQGRQDLAADIRAKTVAVVRYYYEQTGVIYEFYDALNEHPPFACDRKGPRQVPYNIRSKMDSIRDYHWSAALCFLMMMEKGS